MAESSVVAGSILWTVMAEVRAGNVTKRKRVVQTMKDQLKICDSVHFSYPNTLGPNLFG